MAAVGARMRENDAGGWVWGCVRARARAQGNKRQTTEARSCSLLLLCLSVDLPVGVGPLTRTQGGVVEDSLGSARTGEGHGVGAGGRRAGTGANTKSPGREEDMSLPG